MSLRKVNQDPFSNGTEHSWWIERNCECCKKSKPDGLKFKCAIERDIVTRMFSYEPIAQRTINICKMADCPYKKQTL